MLSSISPVGEASRGQRWSVTATAYTLGSTAGGTLIGALLGSLGWLLTDRLPVDAAAVTSASLAVLGATLLAGAVVDSGRTGVRLAGWARQVDERWLTAYRGWVYGTGYGFQLGTGVLTIVSTTATYAMLLAALLSASATTGAAIGASFGAVRALPLVATVRVRSPEALRRLHGRRAAAAPRVAQVTTGTLAVLGALSLSLAVLGARP